MKIIKKTFCLLCTLLLILGSFPVIAHATEDESEEEDKLLAPYFILQSEDAPLESFPLKSTEVITNINGIIAETTVIQTYSNNGDTPISARYVFPTSPNVTVHGMTMEIGNTVVTAQIKEKEEAKAVYEEAKSEGKSASLLEQQRPNVFTMDVANIMPGDIAKITLQYTELITPTDGLYEFVFPTVVGPRYAAPESSPSSDSDLIDETVHLVAENVSQGNHTEGGWVSSPYLPDGQTPSEEYHITVNLSTGVPVAEVSCKSHEVDITCESDSRLQITLSNPDDYAGNRDFILKYRLMGEEVQSGLVLTESDAENFFLLTVQPPARFTPDDIPPREYLFVLDVSGSMSGYPLKTAKALIRDLVGGLKESDTFNVIAFANDAVLLSPESLPATADNIKAATDFINSEEGGGGTSMMPALEKTIAVPLAEDTARSVIIITDGYISNESDIFDLINANMDTASFFAFGIGTAVNSYLIQGIAQTGLGESFIVTDSEDAETAAEQFRTYIESPLLTGVTINYDGFDVYDTATTAPSILYAQKPLVIFGKWRGTPSGTITVSGKTGTGEYTQEIPVRGVTVDTDNEAIRYLWAQTKLDQLAGYGSLRNDPSVKGEITQLGLSYNMTTPYTSFVAVVDVVRNTEGTSQDVNQPLPLPLQVSNLAVGGGYTAYSEPGEIAMALATVGFLLLCLLWRYSKRKKKMPHVD